MCSGLLVHIAICATDNKALVGPGPVRLPILSDMWQCFPQGVHPTDGQPEWLDLFQMPLLQLQEVHTNMPSLRALKRLISHMYNGIQSSPGTRAGQIVLSKMWKYFPQGVHPTDNQLEQRDIFQMPLL